MHEERAAPRDKLEYALAGLTRLCSRAPTCHAVDLTAWSAVVAACEQITERPQALPEMLKFARDKVAALRRSEVTSDALERIKGTLPVRGLF